MGYTVYYRHKCGTPNREQWEKIRALAKRVIKKHKDILCAENDYPEDAPIVNHKEVFFNGKGDAGHETFVLPRYMQHREFLFCKTARKPYDAAVKEILLGVKKILPDWLEISDDDAEIG